MNGIGSGNTSTYVTLLYQFYFYCIASWPDHYNLTSYNIPFESLCGHFTIKLHLSSTLYCTPIKQATMPSEESNRIRTDNVHETGGR